MSDCPGFMSLTMNDRNEKEELLKYDLLVSCPPLFNLTIFVPSYATKESRFFEVLLDDGKLIHRFFLAGLHPPTSVDVIPPYPDAPVDPSPVVADETEGATSGGSIVVVVFTCFIFLLIRMGAKMAAGVRERNKEKQEFHQKSKLKLIPFTVCLYCRHQSYFFVSTVTR